MPIIVPDIVVPPDLDEVRDYLDGKNASFSDGAVLGAIDTEIVLQAKACRVDPYSHALHEAVCRRVASNLARRPLPLGVQASDLGAIRPALEDAEVRRMERPYRRTVVG